MTDFEPLLTRWQSAGVLDAEAAGRIRAYELEQKRPAGLRWQGMVALILGAILLACGVVLFVSAHWDEMGPGARFAVVLAMVSVFHLGGGWARNRFRGLSTALHAVGTVSTGAAIALVGQIFNIQEHWPAAVLLWAIAALAGWILLQDEAQQTLTLLLFPAWILSELSFAAEGHVGEIVYQGRFLVVWAVLYLTFFLGSKRKIVQGILFAVGAIASVVGIVGMLDGWSSWGNQTFLSLGTRTWGWVDIAVLPLLFAVFKFRKSVVPVAVAIVFSIALPWCQRSVDYFGPGMYHTHIQRNEPNIAAHALVAAFAVFIIWWGVRLASKALVNLGIVGFAITVGWFYFSDIFDKMGRSLGLIGLGILFLAGGWVLEKTRRGLLAGMESKDLSTQEAK
ncbi:MAG TPA: DUF2157 domain-containing protein [Terracidiphilus sp.]|nr:DUF2157 domain-containing protein [Terracidiphilus sp.]